MKLILFFLFAFNGFIIANADIPKEDVQAKEHYKTLVDEAFNRWATGQGSPFKLLSETMSWTIVGSSRTAGTYNLEEFNELVIPFSGKLKAPLKPLSWELFSKGNVVAIHFMAQATLKTKEIYTNEYMWIFRFEANEVVKVKAFLDLRLFERALDGLPLRH